MPTRLTTLYQSRLGWDLSINQLNPSAIEALARESHSNRVNVEADTCGNWPSAATYQFVKAAGDGPDCGHWSDQSKIWN